MVEVLPAVGHREADGIGRDAADELVPPATGEEQVVHRLVVDDRKVVLQTRDEDEGGDQRDRPWGPHVEADCQHDPNADAEEIDHGLERIADTEPHQVFPRKSRPWDAQSRLRLRRLGRSQGCHDGRLAWKRMTPVFDSNASRALIGTSATCSPGHRLSSCVFTHPACQSARALPRVATVSLSHSAEER